MPNKFIITNFAEPRSNYWVFNGLDFMWPELNIAANDHYEVCSLLYKTLRKENDKIICEIAKAKFGNVEMMKRIIADEKIIEELKKISEEHLQELQARGVKVYGTKHDPKRFPFSIVRMDIMRANKVKKFINYMNEVAAREPAIKFDPEAPFVTEKQMKNVDLGEFLQAGDVIYLRAADKSERLDFLAEIENDRAKKIKFPIKTATMRFNDKMVVVDEEDLREHSLATEIFAADDNLAKNLADFYRANCASEGMVLKPHLSSSGNAIQLVDAGIKEDDLVQKIQEVITKIKDDTAKINDSYFAHCDKIVAQQRLAHLTTLEDRPDLATGDIRFSAINGELVGAVLRYNPQNQEQVLSFQVTKPLLPDNLDFTEENIAKMIEKSKGDDQAEKYYENLGAILKAAQDTTKWCRENKHFHIGFDVLLGRNSQGEWSYCLTELNNVWPDCIPETRRINRDAGADSHRVNLCDWIVELAKDGRCITDEGVAPKGAEALKEVAREHSV